MVSDFIHFCGRSLHIFISMHVANVLFLFSVKAGKRVVTDLEAESTPTKKARTSPSDTSPSAPPANVDIESCRALAEAWRSINDFRETKSVRDLTVGAMYTILRMWKETHEKFGPKLYVEVHFSEFETVPVMLPERFAKLDGVALERINTLIAAGFPPALKYGGKINDKIHDVGLLFPHLL